MDSKKEIELFASSAKKYCQLIDTCDPKDPLLLKAIYKVLSELQLRVLELPNIETDDEVDDSIEKGERPWKDIFDKLSSLPINRYNEVFDPLDEKDKQSIVGSLPDDLADIYSDLKRGLKIYNSGDIENAVWDWRFHYWIHWGNHLTSALKVIYSHLSDGELEDV